MHEIKQMDNTAERSFVGIAKRSLKNLGKTQLALAKALNVSPAYVSQIFSGKKRPPDLARPRNRRLLKVWSDFLEVDENELIDLIRHEIHKTPLPPKARFPRFRALAITRLDPEQHSLPSDMRGLSLHPVEQRLIGLLTQVYLIGDRAISENQALVLSNLMASVSQLVSDSSFIETELSDHFDVVEFIWRWNEESGFIEVSTDSLQVNQALRLIQKYQVGASSLQYASAVPMVGYVSATEGFVYDDNVFEFRLHTEKTASPIGMNPDISRFLYCVKVRGDSLKFFFGDGALIYVKFGSWREVVNGDVVIFRDQKQNRAFLKKIEFFEDSLLLKPLNPTYREIIVSRSELAHVERVVSVVF